MADIVFPQNALPPGDFPRDVSADVVFYRVLKEHPSLAGLEVEFGDEPSKRTPPWVRVSVVRYLERHRAGQSTPIAALDVFAADYLLASDFALAISSAWPFLKKTTIPGEGYVSGAWVEVEPYRISEPDSSAAGQTLARLHLEVGLRIHPLKETP